MKALVLSEISIARASETDIPLGGGRCSDCGCPVGGTHLTEYSEITGCKVCVINSDAEPLRVEHCRNDGATVGVYSLAPAGAACQVCGHHRVRSGSSVVIELEDDERLLLGEKPRVEEAEAQA